MSLGAASPPRNSTVAVDELNQLLFPLARSIDRTWRQRKVTFGDQQQQQEDAANKLPVAPAADDNSAVIPSTNASLTLSLSARMFAMTYVASKHPREVALLSRCVTRLERAFLALKRRRANAWLQIHEDLCKSEQAYVDNLTTLLDYYAAPIQYYQVLSPEQQAVLFCNIRLIRDFHRGFVQRLAACCSSIALANCFCDVIAFLPHYGVYIKNYVNALKVLRVARKEPEFRRLSMSIELPDKNSTFPDINCFLIMPLQKLTRYQLFLDRFRKILPRGSHSLEQITAVLSLLRERTAQLDVAQPSMQQDGTPQAKLLRPMREAMHRCKQFVLEGISRNPVCVSVM